ncbi:MAG: hypothetical protein ACLP9C_03250 [Acidimicrobiales bacterium]
MNDAPPGVPRGAPGSLGAALGGRGLRAAFGPGPGGGGDAGGGLGRGRRRRQDRRADPAPIAFARTVRLDKESVFEICDALATAQCQLERLGRWGTARSLARALELAEGGLAAGALPRGVSGSAG